MLTRVYTHGCDSAGRWRPGAGVGAVHPPESSGGATGAQHPGAHRGPPGYSRHHRQQPQKSATPHSGPHRLR